MADQKITQLPLLTTPTVDDLLVIVDDPAGATPTTKSVRVDALLALGGGGTPVVSGTYDYIFNATTSAPPGAGNVRVNAASPYTAVTTVWMHRDDRNGNDRRTLLMLHHVNDVLQLEDKDNADVNVRFRLTAEPVDSGTYVTFAVVHVQGSGGALPSGQISVYFGSAAAGGVQDVLWVGPEAPTDPTIELWYDTDAGGGDSMAALPSTCEGRLTTESGVPVSTTDRTAQSTLFFTPYRGNRVSLYSGGAWSSVTFAEVSLALTGLTAARPYDVWLYNNAGTPTLELLAWTNDTTRATALAVQDGIPVKTGDATRRLVGTIYTTAATTTEDSAARRYVWNAQHRVPRRMQAVADATESWAYTLTTFRQANANAANQLNYVVGLSEEPVEAAVSVVAWNTVANATVVCGVGLDSTTVNSALGGAASIPGGNLGVPQAFYQGSPGIGRHFLVWLEASAATGATTWMNSVVTAPAYRAFIAGTVWD